MNGTPWTPVKEQRLRELLAVNASLNTCAKELGTTRGAISGKIKRDNLTSCRPQVDWTPERDATLKKFWGVFRSGMIAIMLRGIDADGVRARAKQIGCPAEQPKKTLTNVRRRQARRPQITQPADELEPLNVQLVNLEAHHCRWPTGMDHDNIATFCGHAIVSRSWCAAHYKIGTQPSRPASERDLNYLTQRFTHAERVS